MTLRARLMIVATAWFCFMMAILAWDRAHGAIPLTCSQVRSYVQTYGAQRALEWARRNGWSDEQISEARRCLR